MCAAYSSIIITLGRNSVYVTNCEAFYVLHESWNVSHCYSSNYLWYIDHFNNCSISGTKIATMRTCECVCGAVALRISLQKLSVRLLAYLLYVNDACDRWALIFPPHPNHPCATLLLQCDVTMYFLRFSFFPTIKFKSYFSVRARIIIIIRSPSSVPSVGGGKKVLASCCRHYTAITYYLYRMAFNIVYGEDITSVRHKWLCEWVWAMHTVRAIHHFSLNEWLRFLCCECVTLT